MENQPHTEKSPSLELLDFYATWCEPCKMLDTILEQVHRKMSNNLKINKIDIDTAPELKDSYQVSSVPVLVLLKNGKPVWRMNGFLTAAELVRIFEKHL